MKLARIAKGSLRAVKAGSAALFASVATSPAVPSPIPPPETQVPAQFDVKGFYHLSNQQASNLFSGANMGNGFMIPRPTPQDTHSRAQVLDTLNKEFDDLEQLGLVVNVTDQCPNAVKEALELGRYIRVFGMTQQGVALMQVNGPTDETKH